MLILMLFMIHTSNSSETATQSLVVTDRGFAAMADEAGFVNAFEQYFFPNGILFAPGPIHLGTWLERKKGDGGTLKWQPNLVGESSAGDMGYTSGPWIYSSSAGQQIHGHYVSIWQKNDAGSYQVVADIGVPHQPPSQEGASLSKETKSCNVAGVADEETGFEEEKLKLFEADQAFSKMALDKGVIEAYTMCTDFELKRFVSGSFPVFGQLDILEEFKGVEQKVDLPGGIQSQWEVLGFDLAESKEFGYTFGKMLPQESTKSEDSYYLRIWKKSYDGAWLVAVEVIN